jgi:hypothetical protein
MLTIPPTSDLIPVRSAFGGLAIYKTSVILSSKYASVLTGESICEHVFLHHIIAEAGYLIFINPRMLSSTSSQHVRFAGLRGLFLNYLRFLYGFKFPMINH